MRISLALLQAGMIELFSYPSGVNSNIHGAGHTHSIGLPNVQSNPFIQWIKSRHLFKGGCSFY
jgi:hypothetical protein